MKPRQYTNIHFWRADFAAYLRRQGVIRLHSHEVARDPTRKWWFVVCGDGYIRAWPSPGAVKAARRRIDRYCGGVRQIFTIRWKSREEKSLSPSS